MRESASSRGAGAHSRYIGGTTLIEDKTLLVRAAQITTVEGRHNTVLNLLNGGSSVPNAIDMVLSPQQVLSVAAPFISGGCDPVAALGLTRKSCTTCFWASEPMSGAHRSDSRPASYEQ